MGKIALTRHLNPLSNLGLLNFFVRKLTNVLYQFPSFVQVVIEAQVD